MKNEKHANISQQQQQQQQQTSPGDRIDKQISRRKKNAFKLNREETTNHYTDSQFKSRAFLNDLLGCGDDGDDGYDDEEFFL